MRKDQEVLKVVNKMISCCELIKYEDFNRAMKQKDNMLEEAEQEDDRIGVSQLGSNLGISTLSIIATITAIAFDGKRLAFIVDDAGFLTGAKWWEG